MIESTKGITLHYYKYSENSVISKIFTERFGIQSYLIKGIRSKNSKIKLNLLQPLTLVQLEVSNKKNNNLQFIKEIKNSLPLGEIMQNMNKRFVTLFMSEVLLKILTEKEEDKNLFNYIWETVINMNSDKKLNSNFPINFLLNLSKSLGFYPSHENISYKYFNLESGEFSNSEEYYCIGGDLKDDFTKLILQENPDFHYKRRMEILEVLISYFNLHHYNLKNLKSHEIIGSLRR